MSSNEGRTVVKATTPTQTLQALQSPKTISNINTGNTLKPQRAIEGPSLLKKIVSPVQSSQNVDTITKTSAKLTSKTVTYNKFVTIHINGGSSWLAKHGFSYNSSVQPILALDQGIIHSIVLYPTVVVDNGLLLLCKNVAPEGEPNVDNTIASIKLDITAEVLPVPILIKQLSDTNLILSQNDRISVHSATDITGVDVEVNIQYV